MRSVNKSKYEEALENVTAVHGINHFKNDRGLKLYLWIIIMALNLLGTIVFVMAAREKYIEGQIVTELNSNCRINQVPFPAVSICNVNLVSMKEIGTIRSLLIRYNRSDEEIVDFFQSLPSLKNYGWTVKDNKHFTEILAILKLHYFTMDTIMEEVHQKCEDLLVFCSFNRKKKKCNDLFTFIKTFEGYCCTFNYGAFYDGSENALISRDNDFEYYEDESDDKAPAALPLIATSESGRRSGLFVILDVEPEEYPEWSLTPFYGAKVFISDPNDFPETTVHYRYLTPGESISLKVKPLIFQTDNILRRLDPAKRNCWFHDEASLEFTNRYSFETCHTECRMATYIERCQCLPYKYPRNKQVRICEFKDLKCLNNVTVLEESLQVERITGPVPALNISRISIWCKNTKMTISKQERKCQPTCYMECNDKKYTAASDSTSFAAEKFLLNITRENAEHLSALRVYYAKPTCTCYKLTLLIDFIYFIATYGGIFSLGFGGSVITLVELSYLVLKYAVFTFTYVLSKILNNNSLLQKL